MLVDFQNSVSFGFSNKFAIKSLSSFSPTLNYIATLPSKMKNNKSADTVVYSTQSYQFTCNFYHTSTLKCTTVHSAVKLKKVVLLDEHAYTQRRLHHWSVALSMVHCHTIMTFCSRCEFFYEDLLLNFYASFVVRWVQICVFEPQIWWN